MVLAPESPESTSLNENCEAAVKVKHAQMPMETEKLTVMVNEGEGVTALLYAAPKKNRSAITVLLGHGAGANQMHASQSLSHERGRLLARRLPD